MHRRAAIPLSPRPSSCVLSHVSSPPGDTEKELSFLSAAAPFNQWINVSTSVGQRECAWGGNSACL